jgi:hypothetical protein
MASATCCGLANLSASTSKPASLKYPFSIAVKKGMADATGQKPKRILGVDWARTIAGKAKDDTTLDEANWMIWRRFIGLVWLMDDSLVGLKENCESEFFGVHRIAM